MCKKKNKKIKNLLMVIGIKTKEFEILTHLPRRLPTSRRGSDCGSYDTFLGFNSKESKGR